MVGALILVCLIGLGYSLLGREGRAWKILPSAPAAERSRPSESDTNVPPAGHGDDLILEKVNKEKQSPPGSATTCDDMMVLVDRSHTIPPDYAPKDLISLPDYGVPTLGGRELLLRREAAEHLRSMVVAAAADGEELVVASAFRSYADQQLAYGRLKSIYGSGADTMSATPGHSQHQLGTAVDFTNAAANYQVRRRFGHTSASVWLQTNATEYGFVLTYPPGHDGTVYNFEPWHFRYIGVENAERLEKSGLTPQEFLVREGVVPDC
ncbi:MAG TPA: M15 family metallopeptidase [Rubrobacter sp.]|nr:M15 family metallopeptidase [Rubrobacter sp.]